MHGRVFLLLVSLLLSVAAIPIPSFKDIRSNTIHALLTPLERQLKRDQPGDSEDHRPRYLDQGGEFQERAAVLIDPSDPHHLGKRNTRDLRINDDGFGNKKRDLRVNDDGFGNKKRDFRPNDDGFGNKKRDPRINDDS